MTKRTRTYARNAYRFAIRTGRMTIRIDNLDCVVDLQADVVTVTDVIGGKTVVPVAASWL